MMGKGGGWIGRPLPPGFLVRLDWVSIQAHQWGPHASSRSVARNSCLRETMERDNYTWSPNSRNAVGQPRLALVPYPTVIATNASARESKHCEFIDGAASSFAVEPPTCTPSQGVCLARR